MIPCGSPYLSTELSEAVLAVDGAALLAERLKGAAGRWVDVSLHESGRTLTLLLHVATNARTGDAWHHASALRLDMALAHPASCTLSHVGRAPKATWWTGWDLCTGNSRDFGPFHNAFWWCSDELFNPEIVGADDFPAEFDGTAPNHRVHERLEGILQVAADRAVELCDPRARSQALRLSPEVRFFAYAASLTDQTGRVGQAIEVCPGLITYAAGCDRNGPRLWELLTGIALGRKLTALIELGLTLEPDRCLAHLVDARSRSAAQLVRRAPPIHVEELFIVLRAPGVDINDAPRSNASVGEWFEVIAAWGRESWRIKDRAKANRLGGFFSKHALALQEHDAPRLVVEEVMDWLEHAGGIVPSRSSSPRNVRRTVEEWHATLHLEIEHDPATSLAKGPTVVQVFLGIQLHPIETVGELVQEGLEMRHCVGGFADAAIAGTLYFFRGTVGPARITVAVVGSAGHWWLREAAGFANRRLDESEREIVNRWVSALR
jgi:hypothetical protein